MLKIRNFFYLILLCLVTFNFNSLHSGKKGGCKKSLSQSKLESKDSDVDINDLFKLGWKYYAGKDGFRQNEEKAFEAWEDAAKQGHMKAQHNVGIMYEKGIGVKKNHKKAAKWLKKAGKNWNKDSTNLFN